MTFTSYHRRPGKNLSFHCVRMQGKDAGDEAGRGPSLEHHHAGALIWTSASRTGKFLLPSLRDFVIGPKEKDSLLNNAPLLFQ